MAGRAIAVCGTGGVAFAAATGKSFTGSRHGGAGSKCALAITNIGNNRAALAIIVFIALFIAAHPIGAVFGRALVVAGAAFPLSQEQSASVTGAVSGAIAIGIA